MKRNVRPLRRHLGWIIALKVIALVLLWAVFVRDARVSVTPPDMARQLAPNPIAEGVPRGQ